MIVRLVNVWAAVKGQCSGFVNVWGGKRNGRHDVARHPGHCARGEECCPVRAALLARVFPHTDFAQSRDLVAFLYFHFIYADLAVQRRALQDFRPVLDRFPIQDWFDWTVSNTYFDNPEHLVSRRQDIDARITKTDAEKGGNNKDKMTPKKRRAPESMQSKTKAILS